MYKYLILFALFSPLIGIYMVEDGAFAATIGVYGYENGAFQAYSIYILTVFVTASLSGFNFFRVKDLYVPKLDVDVLRFGSIARDIFLINFVFLIIFWFGFGAFSTLLGLTPKGEFRSSLGGLGFFPNFMTKTFIPASFSYLTFLYVAVFKTRRVNVLYFANLLVLVVVGMSWGFKTTPISMLLPTLIFILWRLSFFRLLYVSSLTLAFIVLMFFLFDRNQLYYGDVGVLEFIFTRIFVLQGDVSWHVWELLQSNYLFPPYLPTLWAALGDKFLSVFFVDKDNLSGWASYHFDWLLTNLTGAPFEQIADGHSIVGTPFSEGIVAFGTSGVLIFGVLAGLLISLVSKRIISSVRSRAFVTSALILTYFCFYIFPWLIGGAVVQLFHISLLPGFLITWMVLKQLNKRLK